LGFDGERSGGSIIRLIDNTLTSFDYNLPSKEDLYAFSEYLFTIGVDAVELSVKAYERMAKLRDDRKYILDIEFADEILSYPGFYRYVCHQEVHDENRIFELQMNDSREIVKLRALRSCKEIRIVGLDDIMCHESYEKYFNEIINFLPRSTIILNPENTFGCASAIAMQWATDFGSNITTSFTGCKNNAATEEVLMALRLAVRYKPNRDLTMLPEMTNLYEKITGKIVSNKKPIIGKNIFMVEAGIHADGINKNPATYEAYDPCLVGGKTVLVVGKHSGTRAVRLKLEELGLPELENEIVEKLLNHIKDICTENRKSLCDEEFINLVREVTDNEGDQIHR
jgi:homocitrate synthase NifV